MNFLKKLTLILSFIALAVTACQDSFLERLPTASLAEPQLQSNDGLEGALIGAYSMLLGRNGFYSGSSNWFWSSVRGGDANKGTNEGDQSQVNEIQAYTTQTNNASVAQKYATLYEGIARANATLALAANANESVSAANVTRITAEARFLRGHYYFELKSLFDNTPYVDETWDQVTFIPNNQDLWPFIEADFQFAFDNLPDTQGDAGRANKWAAGAYLGKTRLFRGDYSGAKAIFDQVIASGQTANGQTYGLMPNYGDLFLSANDNNMESVFAIQAASNTGSTNNANPDLVLNYPHGGTDRPGGCCGFFQPSIDLANSFRTDANGLPLLDGSYNAPANAIANDLGLQSGDAFTPDAGNIDPRLDHAIGRRGIPYLDWGEHPGFDWIRDQAYGGPYAPKKWVYTQGGIGTDNDGSNWTPGYSTVNVVIIRFADVLLMQAEAEIELNNLEAARTLVNQVRSRAQTSFLQNSAGTGNAANYVVGTYDAAWTDQATARLAVQHERKMELAMEGKRMQDLVRWDNNGTADIGTILNAYLTHEDQFLRSPFVGASFTDTHKYLPIPQDEIDLQGSDILAQNPGY